MSLSLYESSTAMSIRRNRRGELVSNRAALGYHHAANGNAPTTTDMSVIHAPRHKTIGQVRVRHAHVTAHSDLKTERRQPDV